MNGVSFSLSEFLPVWVVELGGVLVLLLVVAGLVFKLNRWLRIVNPLKVGGGSRQSGYAKALMAGLKISITQKDVITDSRLRLVMHQFIFWGFILCGVATTLVWLTGTAEKARTFADIPKIFGNLGGVLLLVGVSYLLLRLVVSMEFRRNRTLGDLSFFMALFLVAATGFTTQYFRMEGWTAISLANYYIHLAANIFLLGAAPFTHFFHAITTPLMRVLAILYPGNTLYRKKYDKITEDLLAYFDKEKK
ncbi:MAG: hypothetical protein QXI25_03365 [Candidatus Caldarchaeum sp.]